MPLFFFQALFGIIHQYFSLLLGFGLLALIYSLLVDWAQSTNYLTN